jgi:phage baseplate assembly protein V
MGDPLDRLRHHLRPLATRIANSLARAVVQLVDDTKKLQLIQLGVLADETIDGAEHHQPYGFSSVPLPGAEAVVVFPNGDRAHPLVIAASDRRYRPTGGAGGEVTVYNNTGAKVVIKSNGDIEIHPAPGQSMLVGDTPVALATKADVTALANFVQGLFVGGTGSAVIPPGTVPQPAGTTVLKGE